MKKFYFLASLVLTSFLLYSCDKDDNDGEEQEKTLTINFDGMLSEKESEYLSNEKNGELISDEYGAKVYYSTFTDKNKTLIFDNYSADWYSTGDLILGDGFTYTNKTDITNPISVAAMPQKGVSGDTYITSYTGYYEASIRTTDNTPYLFKSAYFTTTAYMYLAIKNGDDFTPKFGKEDWCKLIITGYIGDKETESVELYLAKDGEIVTTWKLVDLTPLGKVNKMTFNIESNEETHDPTWGGTLVPTYFSMDNITIAFE